MILRDTCCLSTIKKNFFLVQFIIKKTSRTYSSYRSCSESPYIILLSEGKPCWCLRHSLFHFLQPHGYRWKIRLWISFKQKGKQYIVGEAFIRILILTAITDVCALFTCFGWSTTCVPVRRDNTAYKWQVILKSCSLEP